MLKKVIKMQKKTIALVLIFVLAFYFIESIIGTNEVHADSNRYTYNGSNLDTNIYPGYKEKIDALKSAHPNWNIVIMETGLEWNQVILAEGSTTSSGSPYSLIQGKTGAWVCSTCGTKTYDNGSWYHASEDAIKYYMDPRNWMDPNSPYLLQFMQIGRVETSEESIYNALKGTFLYSMDNARIINNASKNNNANPFYIVARIIQEQGAGGGATYKMQDSDGTYYYNLFNIGASGNGYNTIVANALKTAKSKGWTSIQKSIEGGIQTLFSSYINAKQDTIYLNKFDVEEYQGLYHQYMQNIEAPKTEANSMYNKISSTEILNQGITLVIPVYKNMPANACSSPDRLAETGPKNIRVKEGHYDIIVRSGRSKGASELTRIKDSSVNILSYERYGDGWHKIALEDGTRGYIYFDTTYFEEVADVVTCNESCIVIETNASMVAGPGKDSQVITSLEYGQEVTKIDNSGRYDKDGVTWDRIRLSDGRQGFIINTNIVISSSVNNIFTVRASGGLYLRSEPTGDNIRILSDGSKVTRTQIGTQEINGYYWDKVTTPDGATGYVARAYLRDMNGNVPSGANDVTVNETSTKKDDNTKTIKAEPGVTETSLKEAYGNGTTVTKADGTAVENGVVGTGYKVNIDGATYVIVKLGDVNGDGTIDIIDMALIKRDINGSQKLTDYYKKAGKITSEQDEIDIIDMALIKRYLVGTQSIKI